MASAEHNAVAAPAAGTAHGHRPGRVENDALHEPAACVGPGLQGIFTESLFADDVLSSSVRSQTLRDLFVEAGGYDGGDGDESVPADAARRVLLGALKPCVTEGEVAQCLGGAASGDASGGAAGQLTFSIFAAGARQAIETTVARIVRERQAHDPHPSDADEGMEAGDDGGAITPLVLLDSAALLSGGGSSEADRAQGMLQAAGVDVFLARVHESRWGLDWEAARVRAARRCAYHLLVCDDLARDTSGAFVLDAMEAICGGSPCVLVVLPSARGPQQQQQQQDLQQQRQRYRYTVARLARAARARRVPVFSNTQDAVLYVAEVAHRTARFRGLLRGRKVAPFQPSGDVGGGDDYGRGGHGDAADQQQQQQQQQPDEQPRLHVVARPDSMAV